MNRAKLNEWIKTFFLCDKRRIERIEELR